MGNFLSQLEKPGKEIINSSEKTKKENQTKEEIIAQHAAKLKNKEEKREQFLDYMNGKDCLGCKVVATVNPLVLAGITGYYYKKQNIKFLKPSWRYCIHATYGTLIFGLVWMSFMGLTGSYSIKRSNETFTEYLQRDNQTVMNNARALFKSDRTDKVKE
ncbi:uncharacterized protein LOC134712200 [Mytilus trossulus]|uniref:uncharacterized protein LOC134712200 n=1 Tax=Mytilus trossulus TaxID=6551 RepID=UPI003004DA60